MEQTMENTNKAHDAKHGLTLNQYQDKGSKTAFYPPERGLEYCTIALAGEAGEFANVVKKIIRDNDRGKREDDLVLELGDTLWYVAQVAKVLGYDLEYIAQRNLDKLEARHAKTGKVV